MPGPNLDCMRQYRANPQMYGGRKLMESKKVMVFKDPTQHGTLAYQYCEWGSAADEIMKEEIKAIANDIQQVVEDHGWMSAQRQVYELGKKQFHDSWQHCEWGDVRQKSSTISTLCWCWDAHFGARCIGYNWP